MSTWSVLTNKYTECTLTRVEGDELRGIRRRLGLTQRQLAERMGVTVTSLARWERDEVPISKLVENFMLLLKSTEVPSRRAERKK